MGTYRPKPASSQRSDSQSINVPGNGKQARECNMQSGVSALNGRPAIWCPRRSAAFQPFPTLLFPVFQTCSSRKVGSTGQMCWKLTLQCSLPQQITYSQSWLDVLEKDNAMFTPPANYIQAELLCGSYERRNAHHAERAGGHQCLLTSSAVHPCAAS